MSEDKKKMKRIKVEKISNRDHLYFLLKLLEKGSKDKTAHVFPGVFPML